MDSKIIDELVQMKVDFKRNFLGSFLSTTFLSFLLWGIIHWITMGGDCRLHETRWMFHAVPMWVPWIQLRIRNGMEIFLPFRSNILPCDLRSLKE